MGGRGVAQNAHNLAVGVALDTDFADVCRRRRGRLGGCLSLVAQDLAGRLVKGVDVVLDAGVGLGLGGGALLDDIGTETLDTTRGDLEAVHETQAAVVLRQGLVFVPVLGNNGIARGVDGAGAVVGLLDDRPRGARLAFLANRTAHFVCVKVY